MAIDNNNLTYGYVWDEFIHPIIITIPPCTVLSIMIKYVIWNWSSINLGYWYDAQHIKSNNTVQLLLFGDWYIFSMALSCKGYKLVPSALASLRSGSLSLTFCLSFFNTKVKPSMAFKLEDFVIEQARGLLIKWHPDDIKMNNLMFLLMDMNESNTKRNNNKSNPQIKR